MQADPCVSSNAPSLGSSGEPGHNGSCRIMNISSNQQLSCMKCNRAGTPRLTLASRTVSRMTLRRSHDFGISSPFLYPWTRGAPAPARNISTQDHANIHKSQYFFHEPLAGYVKLRVARAPGVPGTFSRLSVSDPNGMVHVPWCISGSLTSGSLWSRWQRKRARHSQRMCNPHFCITSKKPMVIYFL